jgi:hypothetical protein
MKIDDSKVLYVRRRPDPADPAQRCHWGGSGPTVSGAAGLRDSGIWGAEPLGKASKNALAPEEKCQNLLFFFIKFVFFLK